MLDCATRKKQAIIAKKYGIEAFCFEHYWMRDISFLSKGLEKLLEDGEPDLPFALCWINDPLSVKRQELELETRPDNYYGTTLDWKIHYDYLSQFFKRPNYIKVDNCPLFYIKKIGHIADNNCAAMFDLWQEMARKDGFNGLNIVPLCVCHGDANQPIDCLDKLKVQCEAGCSSIAHIDELRCPCEQENLYAKIDQSKSEFCRYCYGIAYGFQDVVRAGDNSGRTLTNLSYKSFERFLQKTIQMSAQDSHRASNFILLNSWNDWCKQSMFEPNDHDGYELLKIIQKYFV